MRYIQYFIILIITAVILSLNITPVFANSNYATYPNGSNQYSAPYPELLAKWWVWWNAIPNDEHPGMDESTKYYVDAVKCSKLQNGSVWFLPDILPGLSKSITVKCEIPKNVDIMIPISMTECNNGREGRIEGRDLSDQELKDCAFNIETKLTDIKLSVNETTLDVSMLGNPIKTDFFNVTYPQNPLEIWGAGYIKPGVYKAIAEGYFIILHGLSPGNYKIGFQVTDKLTLQVNPDPPREAIYEISIR